MRKFLAITSIFALGACSTGPKVNSEALAKVKTIAIVGFEVVQQQPKDLEFSIGGSSSSDELDRMPMSKNPVTAKHATQIYEVIRKTLKKDMSWQVADVEMLRKNSQYSEVTKEQTSGWRSLPPVGAQFDVFSNAGIMDYWAWEKLSTDKRKQVISDLGVETALVIRARSTLKESFTVKKLYGGGNYHPQVALELKLYAADGSEVIWSDHHVLGEPTSEKAGHFAGISKREALDKLVIAASENAAQKLKQSHDGGPKK